jgi:Ran GTPase-activating protein (RanGAP) involved in mRNA processing and transport
MKKIILRTFILFFVFTTDAEGMLSRKHKSAEECKDTSADRSDNTQRVTTPNPVQPTLSTPSNAITAAAGSAPSTQEEHQASTPSITISATGSYLRLSALRSISEELEKPAPVHLRLINIVMGGDLEFDSFVDIISESVNLVELTLDFVNLGDERAMRLAKVLPTTLTHLSLAGNRMNCPAMQVLAKRLTDMPNLKVLNLKCNEFGPRSTTLLGFIFEKVPKLTYLDLSNNYLGNTSVEILAGKLPALPELTHLGLGFNVINERGLKALSGVSLPKLKSFDFRGNYFNDAAARYLASFITGTQLQTLHLSMNRMNHLRILPFLSIIPENLENLDLSWNWLSDIGVERLMQSVERLKNLKALNLSLNQIGRHGSSALVHELINMRSLQKLILRYNKINLDAATSLLESLPEHLLYLDLSFNDISNITASTLSCAIRFLKKLDLRGNQVKFDSIPVDHLRSALNHTIGEMIRLGHDPKRIVTIHLDEQAASPQYMKILFEGNLKYLNRVRITLGKKLYRVTPVRASAMTDNATSAMTDNATSAMTDNATSAMTDNATSAMTDNATSAMTDNATDATN